MQAAMMQYRTLTDTAGADGPPADVVCCLEAGNTASTWQSLTRPQLPLQEGVSVVVCTYRRPESVGRFLDSLAAQGVQAGQVIVVDASPDDLTETVVRERISPVNIAAHVLYFRVTGAFKGLTRQRNFALPWISRQLLAFFDDDIVLLPGCLEEMIRVHGDRGVAVVGVGALLQNELERPSALWRLRRSFGVVRELRPGGYTRSGMSLPWSFLTSREEVVVGDWLPGGATMWKTSAVLEVGFNGGFSGYANGEDLEFSLRMGRRGALVVASQAQALHLHEAAGRPDAFQMGYHGISNLYQIHRSCLPRRRWHDGVYFYYAWLVDTLIRFAALVRGGERWSRFRFLLGRMQFFLERCTRRPLTNGRTATADCETSLDTGLLSNEGSVP